MEKGYHTRTESTILYVDGSRVGAYRYRHLNLRVSGQIPPFPTWMAVMSIPVPAALNTGSQSHSHVDKQEAIHKVNK
jgi:hypothetical protein